MVVEVLGMQHSTSAVMLQKDLHLSMNTSFYGMCNIFILGKVLKTVTKACLHRQQEATKHGVIIEGHL